MDTYWNNWNKCDQTFKFLDESLNKCGDKVCNAYFYDINIKNLNLDCAVKKMLTKYDGLKITINDGRQINFEKCPPLVEDLCRMDRFWSQNNPSVEMKYN